jgi:Tfp pilus assembly protein PilF
MPHHHVTGQHVQKASAALHERRWLDAAIELKEAIKLNPNNAQAYLELGFLTYGKLGTLEEARTLLEKAIELDPKSGDAHLYLAIVLWRLADNISAEHHFLRAAKLMPNPALAHATFGDCLCCKDRFVEGEEQFLLALGRDPECAPALRDYARLLLLLDRDAEAELLFKKALKVSDDRWSNHRYGAFLAKFPDRKEEAERLLLRAVELDPEYTEAIRDLQELRQRSH